MRLIENRRARTAFLFMVLFTLLAGDAWRYTIGWTGWSIVVGLMAAASVALLIVQRAQWRPASLPYPLLAFLALITLSIAWSFYPGASALGVASTWATVAGAVAVAVTYAWTEILRVLGMALRFVLGLSLVFELVVSIFIRHPVLPPVAEPGIDYANLPDKIPAMLYWSRDELFSGGKIQGIVGNSTLLSFVALLGIIVFGIQVFDRSRRKRWSILWLAVAALCFALTRSATNIIGLVAVLVVVIAVLLVRRAPTARTRGIAYGGIAVVVLAGVGTALVFSQQVLRLLGKSSDLTNRAEIWHSVIQLAQQRPVFGWGSLGGAFRPPRREQRCSTTACPRCVARRLAAAGHHRPGRNGRTRALQPREVMVVCGRSAATACGQARRVHFVHLAAASGSRRTPGAKHCREQAPG
jgi:hypothetical protein